MVNLQLHRQPKALGKAILPTGRFSSIFSKVSTHSSVNLNSPSIGSKDNRLLVRLLSFPTLLGLD